MNSDLLGTAAAFYGVGAATSALLQEREIVRRKNSSAVSARFLATYGGGYAVWLLYGVSIGSVPLILELAPILHRAGHSGLVAFE